jgi:hypothetical protein
MTLTEVRFPAEVDDYLQLHHIITVSTASFTGMPHASTVAYANDGSMVFFGVVGETALTRNVADNRYISFTIDDYMTDWRKVRELQGTGACHAAATSDERERGERLLNTKFAGVPATSYQTLYCIQPIEVHFVDYDYQRVVQQGRATAPERTSRIIPIVDAPPLPTHGAVSTNLDRVAYRAGDIIFRPTDRVMDYFVIVEGEVEVRAEGYGADQTVARLGVGRMFGDQAVLRGQQGAFTAHAVTDCVLLAVDRDSVRDLSLLRTDEP